jgi:dTDP-4-dehydrorhamnose reductase
MRILILGAAGMLGHKIYLRLKNRFPETWAAFRKTKNVYSNYGLFAPNRVIDRWDFTDTARLAPSLDSCRPDWIVNCAGVTTRKADAAGLVRLVQVNALLPHLLAEWCEARGARLIHFSTDCVFSGKGGPYLETDDKDAGDPYGQSKSLGEVGGPRALTLRSSIIGFELGSQPTELLGWMLSQRGRTVRGFTRALYSGVTTTWMAEAVEKIITGFPNLNGVKQVASRPISKADLLKLMNEHFKLGCTIVPDEAVVTDKRLDGSKFTAETGIAVPPWPDLIAALARESSFYEGLVQRRSA